MATQIKLRRGTAAEHTTFTGAEAEVTVNTTNDTIHIHDGVTAGGHEVSKKSDLGTAATADVTTSSTDVTAGRLLKVGDAGILSMLGSTGSDLDVATFQEGVGHKFAVTPVNGPFGSANVWMTEYGSTSTGATGQIALTQIPPSRMAVRATITAPWKEVYHTGNILSAVSQSAGAPTGGIIESGSNANGSYTKFADGTLICRYLSPTPTTTETSYGNVFYANIETRTFPQAFISKPTVLASIEPSTSVIWASVLLVSSTTCAIRLIGATVSTAAYPTYTAIGRWF